MKNEGKKYLLIAIVGLILVIGAVTIIFFIYKDRLQVLEEREEDSKEYVSLLEDGSKQNTSERLKKDRKLDGLDISNIQLTEKAGMTQLTGIIANHTKKVKEECTATITLVDSKGNELTQMKVYIKELQPSESTRLNASATLDYVGAYDFVIKKD